MTSQRPTYSGIKREKLARLSLDHLQHLALLAHEGAAGCDQNGGRQHQSSAFVAATAVHKIAKSILVHFQPASQPCLYHLRDV